MNYLLTICYDGANYNGWQIQPNQKTVQGELEIALKEVFKTEIKMTSCTVYYTEQTKGREVPWTWKAMPKK